MLGNDSAFHLGQEQGFKPNCEITLYDPNVTGQIKTFRLAGAKLGKNLNGDDAREEYPLQVQNAPAFIELNKELTYKNLGNESIYTLIFEISSVTSVIGNRAIDKTIRFTLPQKDKFKVLLTLEGSPIEQRKWRVLSGPHFDPITNVIEMIISHDEEDTRNVVRSL